MKKLLVASICAVLASWFCQAAAADPVTDDVHCYIISAQMMDSKDSAQQMVAMMSHNYWLGKLDGRTPNMDLEARVLAELPQMMHPDFFKAEAVRCGTEMVARGKAESAMGADIKQRGLKMMQEENSR